MSWKLGEEKKKGVSSATVLTAAAAARFVCGDDGDGYDKTGTIMAVLDSIDVGQSRSVSCMHRLYRTIHVPAFRRSDADKLAGERRAHFFPGRHRSFFTARIAFSAADCDANASSLCMARLGDCEPAVDLTTCCHDTMTPYAIDRTLKAIRCSPLVAIRICGRKRFSGELSRLQWCRAGS